MIKNVIIFDGVPSDSFGIYAGSTASDNAPERDIETVVVPGRNGTLTIDNGRFQNIEIPYTCFIRRGYEDNIAAARAFYCSRVGYKRLEDSTHPDEYRMARYASGMEVTPSQMRKQGYFTLTFDAMPQRFLKTGETPAEYTENGKIYNATMFDAKPLLRVYGIGTFGVGTEIITILDNPLEFVDIDCESMDAYNGATNCNSYIRLDSGDFPVLAADGETGVALGSGITKIVITPRWYTI